MSWFKDYIFHIVALSLSNTPFVDYFYFCCVCMTLKDEISHFGVHIKLHLPKWFYIHTVKKKKKAAVVAGILP